MVFRVKTRAGAPPREGTVNRRGAQCLVCGTPIPLEHVRKEGQAGHMGARLMAIVTEEAGGRGYHAPDPEHEVLAQDILPTWKPDFEFAKNSRHMTPWVYGLGRFSDLFTPASSWPSPRSPTWWPRPGNGFTKTLWRRACPTTLLPLAQGERAPGPTPRR